MKICIWLLTVLLTFKTFAGILVEPYVGINLAGSTKLSSLDANYDNTPVSLGARLGITKLMFSLGLDYQTTQKIKVENNTEKFDSNELAAFVGFDFPILLRAYAGYIFSGKFDGNNGNDYKSGSGYKLGVGFTGFPFISINLEYKALSYDKLNGADLSPSADNNATMLSISLPLKLL